MRVEKFAANSEVIWSVILTYRIKWNYELAQLNYILEYLAILNSKKNFPWIFSRSNKENNVFPMGIAAYHQMAQPGPKHGECYQQTIENPCAKAECQGMCLLRCVQ
jgi:hypothetical protein